MSDKKLSVSLAFQSSSFQKQVQSINKDTKLLEYEMTKLTKKGDEYVKSTEGQAKKLEILNKMYQSIQDKLTVYNNKMNATKDTLEKANSSYEKQGDKVNDLKNKLQEAEKTYGKNSEEVKKLKEQLKDAEQVFKNKANAVMNADNALKQIKTEMNKCEDEASDLTNEINQLNNEINGIDGSVGSGNFSALGNNMDEAGQKALDFRAKMAIVGEGMVEVGEKALNAGKDILEGMGELVSSGADYEIELNSIKVMLKDNEGAVREWAKQNAASIGLTENQLTLFAAKNVKLAEKMGLSGDAALEMGKNITIVGQDLATFYDVDPSEMISRFNSGLNGSTEVLDNYGIDLNVASLEQNEFFKSMNKSWNSLSEGEKRQVRMNQIMTQTADLTGNASREADSFAVQQQLLNENIKEVEQSLGMLLIPILQPLIGMVKEVVEGIKVWVEQNPELARVIMIVVSVLGALLTIFGAIMIPLGMATLAMSAFSMATLTAALPILGIIAAIAAVIAILAVLYVNWDKITKFLTSAWNACITFIQNGIKGMLDKFTNFSTFVQNLLGGLSNFFKSIGLDWMANLLDGLKSMWANITKWVTDSVNWLLDKLQFWKKGTDTMSTPQSGAMPMSLQAQPMTLDSGVATFGLDTMALSGQYYQADTFASKELSPFIQATNGTTNISTQATNGTTNMEELFNQFANKMIGALSGMNISVQTTNMIGNRELASVMTDNVVKTMNKNTALRGL